MASQAVYCLSLQIRPPNEDNAESSGQQANGSKMLDKKHEATNTTIELSTNRPQQMQTQQPTQQTHSNFILVRAARSENGQIILQNSHELLSLLSDDDKPILLQQQRLKTKAENVQHQQQHQHQHHQTTIKTTGSMDGTILLQSSGMKKNSMQAPEGSIILQQRLNKNGTNDGPILLQTLKRLDKSQSILLIRNTPTTATVTTATSNSVAAAGSSGASGSHSKSNNAPVAMIEDNDDRPVEMPPQKQKNIPLGLDGEPIKLPDNLESLPRADHFPTQRHRWNTNEEIAAILISFDKHSEWQSKEVKTRPKSGSMLLYSRKKVRYRRDGYCWKKRKDGKTTREDHMKLKVQGTECIYGCYVHSAILPTFHRRCYWLLQNPDIVLVHYLNVPYPDDNKMAVITPSLALWGDKKEWTKEELVSQLKPMFFSEDETDASNEIEISKFIHSQTAETVEAIVGQLMEKQRLARQAALVKQLECGCPDSTCADGKSCSHPMRRITSAKPENKRQDNSNQVTSTTPNVLVGSRLFPRWIERRGRENLTDNGLRTQMTKTMDGSSIHFQVIPTTSQSHTNITNQNSIIRSNNSHNTATNNNNNNNLNHLNSNSNYSNTNTTNLSHLSNNNNNTNLNNSQLTSVNTQSNANNMNNNPTTITTTATATVVGGHRSTVTATSNNGQIFLTNSNNNNNSGSNVNDTSDQMTMSGDLNSQDSSHNSAMVTNQNSNSNNHQSQQQQQQQQQQHLHQSHHNQQQQQQQQQQSIDNNNMINGHNGRATTNLLNQNQIINNNNRISVNNTVSSAPIVTSAPPLVLSLSQINGTNGSLFILNNQQQQTFVCQPQQQQQLQQQQQQQQQIQQQNLRKQVKEAKKQNQTPSQQQPPMLSNLVPKLEAMDSSTSSSSMSTVDKHFQDFIHNDMNFSSTRQNTPHNSPSKDVAVHGMKDPNDPLHFFNETLDLSQEDIQRTLSANMPLGGHTADDAMNGEINPMDFIENCHNGGADDDVFVNLDAFDMLVEFPELELDPKSSFLHASENDDSSYKPVESLSALANHTPLTQTDVSTISDYSPEWAYPEGGVKVLVTGPWTSASSYTVLFDSFPVPTTLVQNGVLRCYCPAHEVGVANLQVASDGYVISNSVNFEYKSPPKVETKVEGSSNDVMYKFSLLNRLETIDEKLQIKSEPTELPEDSVLFNQPNFEDRLVNYCQSLITKTWRSMTPGAWITGHKGMTLLHLASALGYSKLVCAMLKWRSENSSIILEAEIDALSQDIDGFTPLMWACARGHKDTAMMLYKWNHNALNVKNVQQLNCLDLAKNHGFKMLASELLQCDENRQQKQSNDTIYMTNLENSRNHLHLYNITFSSSSSFQSILQNSSTTTTSRTSSKDQLIGKNLEGNGSGYGMIDGFSQCSSPNSILGDRSHDGVFLRPGAVSASQSPPGARLSKRPSIDSGINMDSRASSTRSGKSFKDNNHRFFNRMDRSMSLPISSNSPQSLSSVDNLDNFSLSIDRNNDSNLGSNNTSNMTSNNSLLSPLRKMDFALCEVSTGSASPIDEQQESTIEEEANIDDNIDNNQGGGVVGESDAKVLTLAEQIIAAMPDRIKNESEEMSLGSPLQESLANDSSSMAMLNDSFMEPLLDSLPSSQFDHEFNFEFSDQHYRYHDVSTPCSSLSPASSGPLQSPASYSVAPDPSIGSPSPPPTTEDFTEFLQASNTAPRPFEADFSNLTLTDREQRELYEAAKCIQKAYRSYKGRQKLEEQDKERSAAVVIQNYYRRYKQYAYYRQMTHAALVIQNGYRSYCENKRFKKSQNPNLCASSSSAMAGNLAMDASSQCIQNYYRSLQQQHGGLGGSGVGGSSSKEASPSGPLKRTYSQRTQNQAARKIQQFMRQSKNNLWDEHMTKMASERASRKREAGAPTQGGVPSKLAVSRTSRGTAYQRSKK